MPPCRRLLAVQIHPDARRSVLVDLLTVYGAGGKCIVFANTKRDADEVSAAIANSMPTEVRGRASRLSLACVHTGCDPADDSSLPLC